MSFGQIDGEFALNPALHGHPAAYGIQYSTLLSGPQSMVATIDNDHRLRVNSLAGPGVSEIVDNVKTVTNTTETSFLDAGGSGVFHDLISVLISNQSALPVKMDIRDSDGGATRSTIEIGPKGSVRLPCMPEAPFFQPTDDEDWTIELASSSRVVSVTAIAKIRT